MPTEKEILEALSKATSNYLITVMKQMGHKINTKEAENMLNNIVAHNLREHL